MQITYSPTHLLKGGLSVNWGGGGVVLLVNMQNPPKCPLFLTGLALGGPCPLQEILDPRLLICLQTIVYV